MARSKPKREKAAIPASYIRPRELPDGRTSYNVRAYDPATRTCKTLGTFKTRRAAERAFKKGAEALVANARPEPPPDVAPTASAELDEPRPSPSVSKKRARSPPPPPRVRPRAPELAFRRGGAHVPEQEAPEDEKREKRNRRRPTRRRARGGEDPGPRASRRQTRLRGVPHARQRRRRGVSVREPGRSGRSSGAPRAESSRVWKPGGRVGEQPARRPRAHLLHPGGDAAARRGRGGARGYGRRGHVEPRLRVRTRGGVPRPRPRALGRRARGPRGFPRRRRPRGRPRGRAGLARPRRAPRGVSRVRRAAATRRRRPPPPGSRDAPRASR
jgi:hypothetical protein